MRFLKDWILSRQFVKDDIKIARDYAYFQGEKAGLRQGAIDAFPLAQKDVLETMRDDIDEQAEELAKAKLAALLSPVDLSKIIAVTAQGVVKIGGDKADEITLSNLKAEAEFFLQSELWHLIHETPKELAQRSMFVAGESLADMQRGKSILYCLSAQDNIVKVLSSYGKRA